MVAMFFDQIALFSNAVHQKGSGTKVLSQNCVSQFEIVCGCSPINFVCKRYPLRSTSTSF